MCKHWPNSCANTLGRDISFLRFQDAIKTFRVGVKNYGRLGELKQTYILFCFSLTLVHRSHFSVFLNQGKSGQNSQSHYFHLPHSVWRPTPFEFFHPNTGQETKFRRKEPLKNRWRRYHQISKQLPKLKHKQGSFWDPTLRDSFIYSYFLKKFYYFTLWENIFYEFCRLTIYERFSHCSSTNESQNNYYMQRSGGQTYSQNPVLNSFPFAITPPPPRPPPFIRAICGFYGMLQFYSRICLQHCLPLVRG